MEFVKKIDTKLTLKSMSVGEQVLLHVTDASVNMMRAAATRLKTDGYEFRISEISGSPTYTIERIK